MASSVLAPSATTMEEIAERVLKRHLGPLEQKLLHMERRLNSLAQRFGREETPAEDTGLTNSNSPPVDNRPKKSATVAGAAPPVHDVDVARGRAPIHASSMQNDSSDSCSSCSEESPPPVVRQDPHSALWRMHLSSGTVAQQRITLTTLLPDAKRRNWTLLGIVTGCAPSRSTRETSRCCWA